MGSVGRAIGTLGLTLGGSLLGPAGFAVYGAALGSFAGGILFAPRNNVQGFRLDSLNIETSEYGVSRNQFFGQMRTTGVIIDGRYVSGVARCLEEDSHTSKKGGIFGFGGTKVTSYKYYESASFMWGKGPLFVDKLWFEDGTEKRVIYDRYGATEEKRGYELTPQLDSLGRTVCELSAGLDLFHGYDSQPVSTWLQAQHPEGVPAYRGSAYTNLKRFYLKNGQGKLIALVRSPETGRRQIIEQVLTDCGVPPGRLWLEGMDENISQHTSGGGAVLEGTRDRAEFISQIAMLAQADIGHVDGLVVNRSRLAPIYHVLQLDELGAHEWTGLDDEGDDLVRIQPVNVVELPSVLRIEFQDPNLNYDGNWVRSIRETALHTNEVTISLPFAATLQEMQYFCDTLLDAFWAADATYEVELLPRRIPVAVGDILMIPDDGGSEAVFHSVRITEQSISPDGIIACKGSRYDGGVYGQFREIENVVLPEDGVEVFEAPLYGIFDIPAIDDFTASGPGFLVAAAPPAGTSWAGAEFVLASGGSLSLEVASTLGKVVGEITLPDSVVDGIDETATLRIELINGTLAPAVNEDYVLHQQANLLAVNTSAGVCLLQFLDAVAVGGEPNQWDISGILVQVGGTDYALSISDGAQCVLLTGPDGQAMDGPDWMGITDSQIGVELSFEVRSLDEAERSDGFYAFTPTGNSLKPPSPASVTKESEDENEIVLGVAARSRLMPGAGGIFRPSDPNNFRLRIMDGETVKITKNLSGTAEVILTKSELLAAFGALPVTLEGDIGQISSRIGLGYLRAFRILLVVEFEISSLREDWTDTGIDLTPEQSVTVSASGTPSFGDDEYNATGRTTGSKTGGLNFGCLAGIVNPVGTPSGAQSGQFNCGITGEITGVTGRLWLRYNDSPGQYGNNSGSFTISIS